MSNESLVNILTELYNTPPKEPKKMVMYWGCITNGMTDQYNACKNKDCKNCSSYRKALIDYGRG